MGTEKFEIRKTSVPGSDALIVHQANETVLYIKPYKVEASKLADLIAVIDKFFNREI